MRKVREVIVVEGRYDKNALRQVVDAVILETSGFGIFRDTQKQKLPKLSQQLPNRLTPAPPTAPAPGTSPEKAMLFSILSL